MKRTILTLCTTLPALATELPPAIPDGPVTYDAVSYQAPAPAYDSYMPAAAYTDTITPATPSVTSGDNGYIKLNVYSSDYTVRGMGFTNDLTNYGYSSISGSAKLPFRNIFGAEDVAEGELGTAGNGAVAIVGQVIGKAHAAHRVVAAVDIELNIAVVARGDGGSGRGDGIGICRSGHVAVIGRGWSLIANGVVCNGAVRNGRRQLGSQGRQGGAKGKNGAFHHMSIF